MWCDAAECGDAAEDKFGRKIGIITRVFKNECIWIDTYFRVGIKLIFLKNVTLIKIPRQKP